MGSTSRVLLSLAAALTWAVVSSAAERGPGDLHRGPVEARDEWLLAQPQLTLPPIPPDPLGAGVTELRLDGDWGSDFGFDSGPGGREDDLRYLVDGEHRSVALTVRRGLGRRWTIGARAVLLWRGGGVLDGLIDTFHDVSGLPDSGRPLFPSGQLRVEAREAGGRAAPWEGRPGTGLGNLEMEARRSFRPPEHDGWRTAVVVRLSAPTATGPFAGVGAQGGAQLLAAHALGSRAEVYGGVGLAVRARRAHQGLRYPRTRAEVFTALDVRLTRGWSVVAQVDGGGRLVDAVDSYPGALAYLRMVTRVRLGRVTAEAGFTEGIVSQTAATDFGLRLGIRTEF